MWDKIVLDLISNAFKYTFEGEVEVSLCESADRRHVELRVRDTGLGIPTKELPRLFERFRRIEGQHGRTHEGTGIGLALVQELTRLHGGTVESTSAPGRGSCFTVSIPVGYANSPAGATGAARMPSSTAYRAEAFAEEALRWLPGEQSRPEIEIQAEPFNQFADSVAAGGDPSCWWPTTTPICAPTCIGCCRRAMRWRQRLMEKQRWKRSAAAVRSDPKRRDDAAARWVRFAARGASRSEFERRAGGVAVARAGEEASIEGLEAALTITS